MSEKSVTIHNEDTGPVTIKLSGCGRISLSDITAATIGDLESWTDSPNCATTNDKLEPALWTDSPNSVTTSDKLEPAHLWSDSPNSVTTSDKLEPAHSWIDSPNCVTTSDKLEPANSEVLRPWEDKTLMDRAYMSGQQSQVVSSSTDTGSTSRKSDLTLNISSSGEHLKRQLEDFYSLAEGPQWKRQRQTEHSATTILPSWNNNNTAVFKSRSSYSTNSALSLNDMDTKLPKQDLSVSYSALLPDQKQSENYAYPSLSLLCDNAQSSSTTQSWYKSDSNLQPDHYNTPLPRDTMGSLSNFYKDHFKVSHSDMSKAKDIVTIATNVHKDIPAVTFESPSITYFKTEPVTPDAKQLSIMLPINSNYDNSPGMEPRFNKSLSNLIATPDTKRPNMLPTNSNYENSPGMDSKINKSLSNLIVTPDTKRQNMLPTNNSNYDNSPGMESRFNESLSNLIGSPPPDSPLSKNPFFGDLQALLSTECKAELLPKTLFGIQNNTPAQVPVKQDNIFVRERKLHDRFNDLQVSQADEIRNLSSFFRYQTAMIETERFRTLHESQYPQEQKNSVNRFYDDKIHQVMDRVERSVHLLENANKENLSRKLIIKPRPQLNREAVLLMENWYRTNIEHPYPTNITIELLANSGNISTDQVKKWFANKRNRSQNTRTLTEIAMKKRKLGQLAFP